GRWYVACRGAVGGAGAVVHGSWGQGRDGAAGRVRGVVESVVSALVFAVLHAQLDINIHIHIHINVDFDVRRVRWAGGPRLVLRRFLH
ncbi:hypothetical protein ADK38_43295, partial [Streptomyces varsoviensis]